MQAGLEERKKKIKKRKRKRGSIQGFAWPNRNVSRERAWRLWRRGKLKGREKKMLKPSGIAWENREFESYPPSCSTVSQ